ncbi:hypothetical protein [Demequina mangrovi]|nr:hypothetical protein [Demequina mangrovi]
MTGCDAAAEETTTAATSESPAPGETVTVAEAFASATPSPSVTAEPGPECLPTEIDWTEDTDGSYLAGTYVVAKDGIQDTTALKPDELNGVSVALCDGKWLIVDPTEDLPEEIWEMASVDRADTLADSKRAALMVKNLEICSVRAQPYGTVPLSWGPRLNAWQANSEWREANSKGQVGDSTFWWSVTGTGVYTARSLGEFVDGEPVTVKTADDALEYARTYATPELCLNYGTNYPTIVR